MVSAIWTRRGSITQTLRHLVKGAGGTRIPKTAKEVIEDKQKPKK